MVYNLALNRVGGVPKLELVKVLVSLGPRCFERKSRMSPVSAVFKKVSSAILSYYRRILLLRNYTFQKCFCCAPVIRDTPLNER
jgi:hypothetical protein